MAINFNVRNDNAISQLAVHPEIGTRGGALRDAAGYIAVDSTITVSDAAAAAYWRLTVAPLSLADRGKIGKTRFLDGLKSYVRENGLTSLESATVPESDDAPAAVAKLIGAGAISVPVIAFLLNARTVAGVIQREYDAARAAGAPLPAYTLPGLKLAIRTAIATIGRAGIAAIAPDAAATLAAFNAIPLLFSAPPAGINPDAAKSETETATAETETPADAVADAVESKPLTRAQKRAAAAAAKLAAETADAAAAE